ncbi:hypothetical protein BDU57DRAFT_558557 [Ampelomyces quisqualis]|uniref:Uncharacterized protein n=1 Tax=Ampelomyces quisqualis TaxID=50730 RepID=A0A6A5QGB3_AMPQU|nr:hypothetical protein BDU57DRAFT_558557 [Ampelomyces quisqualis]
MRRGLSRQTSHAASRTSDTGNGQLTQQPSSRSRAAQNHAPLVRHVTGDQDQARTRSARRHSYQQPTTSSSQQSQDVQSVPERKAPAYLHGKNPYGQVLDTVGHPYRAPRAAPEVQPPAQVGARIEGRPRTAGAFHFKTRASPVEPERAVVASHSEQQYAAPRQPAKHISVQAVKNFFERKACPAESASHAAPTSLSKTRQTAEPFAQPRAETAHLSHSQEPERQTMEHALLTATPLREGDTRDLQPQRKKPSTRPGAKRSFTHDMLSKDVSHQDYSVIDDNSVVSKSAAQATGPVDGDNYMERKSVAQRQARQTRHRQNPDETVRRRPAREHAPAAEIDEAPEPGRQARPRRTQRSRAGQDIGEPVEKGEKSSSSGHRRHRSLSAPLDDATTSASPHGRRVKRTSSKTPTAPQGLGASTYDGSVSESIHSETRIADTFAAGFSHDGSSEFEPNLSRRSTTQAGISTANMGVQPGYQNVEVPDHVDWRSAYGRRKTQDFGFPGARIKPRRTIPMAKPIQDPGDWTRRSCGHFSHMGKSETRDSASQRPCQQCLTRFASPSQHSSRIRRTRKRAATDSSLSSSSKSSIPYIRVERRRKRRQHHSECCPTDKCGDTFAKDLGYIIDEILDEHSNSLQSVISNIKHSQPRLKQLRRVSEDLVQRCQEGGVCSSHRHASCQPSCQSSYVQQILCHPCQPPVVQPQECKWEPPQSCAPPPPPCVPPKAAEKLNVGSPGQVGPNLNDHRPSLQETVKTVPDLIDLVNSAADDLGVDLERRPTAQDDELFQKAPYQEEEPVSTAQHQSDVTKPPVDEEQPSEDPWLQQTRRHLSELSEAHLDVQLQDRSVPERVTDPIQKLLSRVSTQLSRRSTGLRNKSIASKTEENVSKVDPLIEERKLSRMLTDILDQSRRMTEITQDYEDLGETPPPEALDWLELAQTELPAAVDAILNVLDTLPAPQYEEPYEMEPQFESTYELESDVEYEPDPESDIYEEESIYDEPQRSYTEPLSQLHDRIMDLERRLEKGPPITPSERNITSENVQSEPSAAIETEERVELPVERVATRRATMPPPKLISRSTGDGEEDKGETLPPPIERLDSIRRASTIGPVESAQRERTFSLISPVPSEPEDATAFDFEPEITRQMSTRKSMTAPPQEAVRRLTEPTMELATPEEDFEPELQLKRLSHSSTYSGRRQSVRSPSPITEVTEESAASLVETAQSLKPRGEDPPEPVLQPSPEERFSPSPEPIMRKATTRKATIHEPPTSYTIPLSRKSTEQVFSPDEMSVQEPVAPPSSPSTGEEATPPLRRQSTAPERYALPESSSSLPSSPISVAEEPSLPEHMDQEPVPPPTMTRRSTTIYDALPGDLRRTSTSRSSPFISRRTTAASRQPSFAQKRTTPTIMSDPIPEETVEPPLSRVMTRQTIPSRQATRALTMRGPTRPPSRQPTRRTSDIPELLQRNATEPHVISHRSTQIPTRQNTQEITRRPTQPEPEPISLPPVESSSVSNPEPTRVATQVAEVEPEITDPESILSQQVSRVSTRRPSVAPSRQQSIREPKVPEEEEVSIVAQSRKTTELTRQPTQPPVDSEESSLLEVTDLPRRETLPDETTEAVGEVLREPEEQTTTIPDTSPTSLLDEPLAAYDVYNASPEPTVAEDVAANDLPEPFAEPSEVEAELEEPKQLQSRKTRFDPELDDRVPTVLKASSIISPRPRSVSVAPGIEVAPPALGRKDSKPPAPVEKKPRQKTPNFPPEQQHPPAPVYPSRETPSWTKPDNRTPPPKAKAEPKPKKRGFFTRAPKPKEPKPEPEFRQHPEPHRHRVLVAPFRYAAPGRPGPPGGTLQRPRGYVYPRQPQPYRPVWPRIRRQEPVYYEDPPSSVPRFARKDDYYPRLAPVANDRRYNYPPPQPAPLRREPYSEYRAPVQYVQPRYPPPRNDYAPPRARPRPQPSYRPEISQRPLRSQAPAPVRHQPQTQQAPRHKEKTPNWFKAHVPPRRPQVHQEPPRPRPVPRDETFSRPPRRAARRDTISDDESEIESEANVVAAPQRREKQAPKASSRAAPGRSDARHTKQQGEAEEQESEDEEPEEPESMEQESEDEESVEYSNSEFSSQEEDSVAEQNVDGASGRPPRDTARKCTGARRSGNKLAFGPATSHPTQDQSRVQYCGSELRTSAPITQITSSKAEPDETVSRSMESQARSVEGHEPGKEQSPDEKPKAEQPEQRNAESAVPKGPEVQARPDSDRQDSVSVPRAPARRTTSFFGRRKEAKAAGGQRGTHNQEGADGAQQPIPTAEAKGGQGGSSMKRWGFGWGRG